jgi:hypothetical protein
MYILINFDFSIFGNVTSSIMYGSLLFPAVQNALFHAQWNTYAYPQHANTPPGPMPAHRK